jgi:hypothetical protein
MTRAEGLAMMGGMKLPAEGEEPLAAEPEIDEPGPGATIRGAQERERIANEREVLADDRERLADEREFDIDERELLANHPKGVERQHARERDERSASDGRGARAGRGRRVRHAISLRLELHAVAARRGSR